MHPQSHAHAHAHSGPPIPQPQFLPPQSMTPRSQSQGEMLPPSGGVSGGGGNVFGVVMGGNSGQASAEQNPGTAKVYASVYSGVSRQDHGYDEWGRRTSELTPGTRL